MRSFCNIFLTWYSLFFPLVTAPAQGLTSGSGGLRYEEIFGDRFGEAVAYFRDEKSRFDSLGLMRVDPSLACAVVFPEVLRYSVLRDKLETTGLEVLYAQYGKEYADFSVGRFQMKPGFAEQVEKDYNRMFSPAEKKKLGIPGFPEVENTAQRIARIRRLQDIRGETMYLALFILIADKIFSREAWNGVGDKVRFYATAYNAGYKRSAAAIRKRMPLNFFHTGLVSSATKYNYADISLYFYNMDRNVK